MDIDQDLVNRIDRGLAKLKGELLAAMSKHRGMASPHEGHSVIREELEELWEHVRADTGDTDEARKEAMQVAAMGLRYALDLCAPFDDVRVMPASEPKIHLGDVVAIAPKYVKAIHIYGDPDEGWLEAEGFGTLRLSGELMPRVVVEALAVLFVKANPEIKVERYPKHRKPAMFTPPGGYA
jgi:hypothetical protein